MNTTELSEKRYTVMLVDDEKYPQQPAPLCVASRLVLLATSGAQARKPFELHPIDLIVCDAHAVYGPADPAREVHSAIYCMNIC